ncbi:glycosyltransferase [Merismopedia glauca]|uniref:Glycosyl transferase n=1 Tax=Merismopedia glauca CCAP 1448/3 TaxID=1296344 RepID=A0A2T1C7M0_9CYAN|nr:glycosyltransferase [Merismopedia glauca]PSB04143.1 glycosyl transferase [Merismopedia glauca CCAP 1448/3]
MTVESPIQIFVGTEKEQLLALKVLEYSIHKHSTLPVQVTPLFAAIEQIGINIPVIKDKQKQPRTPFSFQRFTIPELKSYRGRAIYLDSDMQVFQDIKELWLWNFDGADILSVYEPESSQRSSQFSVMVLNCEQLTWKIEDLIEDLNRGKWTYEQLMFELAPAKKISQVLPSEWNDLERYQPGKTALTHYTDMPNQPWLNVSNPLGWLWCQELFAAIQDKIISLKFVEEQVKKGWVRPSLIYQLKHEIIDPLSLSKEVIKRDERLFTPPHAWRKPIKFLMEQSYLPERIKRIIYRLYAEARYVYQQR